MTADLSDHTELPPVEQQQQPQRPLQNQDLSSVTTAAGELLSVYGWYLLVATALLYLLIQYLNKKNQSDASVHSSAPSTHHDVSEVTRRQEAMEAARRRMQEEQDAKAAEYKEKQKQQEEARRKQKIESWDSMTQGKSYKGNASQSADEGVSATVTKRKPDKKPLRSSDYNPLSGEGGGACAWRPGRKGPSTGG